MVPLMRRWEQKMGRFKSKKPRTGYVVPVSIMSQDIDREWKDVYPQFLQVGDIVAGKGVITYHSLTCRNEVYIEAGIPESKEYILPADDTVKAFVKKGN